MAGEFLDFAELNDSLTATSKKLEKRALIATYLQALGLEDAARAALYLAGTPFAETDRRKLNVGGSLLTKALMQRAGLENEAGQAALHAAYRRHGDLGAAAEDLLSNAAPVAPSLTLKMVEDLLAKVAAARGPGAKLPLVVALLDEAAPVEAKYLLKLMLGDMRTGVKQSLVEEAIAAAFEADAAEVRRASMLAGSLPAVVRLAAERRLGEARMELFHPLGFMLASPVDSVEEAVERFTEEVLLEVSAPEASVPDAGGHGEGGNDVSGSHSPISRARCGAPGLQKESASGSKRIPQRLKPTFIIRSFPIRSFPTQGMKPTFPQTKGRDWRLALIQTRLFRLPLKTVPFQGRGFMGFWRTSTTGFGRRYIAAMVRSRGGWRFFRAAGTI